MSFLAPFGLLALLVLPLILLLHFMRERRRRVVVPSLLLWQMLPRRQEAQRRRRLPLTLLLLLHLLAAALLALALAQPQWLRGVFGREQHLAVVVDTSASMAAPAGGLSTGSRLAAAQARATALIGAMGGRDSLTLIAAGPQARTLDSAGTAGADRLRAALGGLAANGVGSDIVAALLLAEAAVAGQPGAQIVVLTDGALPTLETDLQRRAPGLPVRWEAVGGVVANRAVVTLAARPRGATAPVRVYLRAVNYGNTALRTVLRLYGDDLLLDTRAVSFRPNGEAELTWTLPAGIGLLRAELDGDDDLPADDRAEVSLATVRPLRAVLVSLNPGPMERALRAVPGLALTVIEPAAYVEPAPADIDLTVFDGTLPAAWPAGAVLVLNPPPTTGPLLEVGGRTSSPEPADGGLILGQSASLFDGVSLGSIDFGPVPAVLPPAWATVQLARGEQPLVLRGEIGQSEIAIWSFDLARGNLATRLAFPLLVARTVRDLAPAALPAAVLAGEQVALRPDPRADSVELRAPDGTTTNLPVRRGEDVTIDAAMAGLYAIYERRGGQTLYAGQLPVNSGAPVESDLAPQRLPAAAASGQPATGLVAEDDRRSLWPWLAMAALVVIVTEWLYVHGRHTRELA